jgi:hypothetical protein
MINSPDDDELRKAAGVDHQNCRMGKWYEGDGKVAFGNLPSYRTLLDPHGKVHSGVHKTVALLGSGWEGDNKVQAQIIAEMEGAEVASADVMQVLNRMVAEKHPHMARSH